MATMRSNPLLRFHRAAEAASYPALLIVSMVALTIVVTGVMLLGMVGGAAALALAIVSLFAAVALVWGAIEAALSDADDPPAGPGVDPPASRA